MVEEKSRIDAMKAYFRMASLPPKVKRVNDDLRTNNIRQAIKSLEYLIQVETDPIKRIAYQDRMSEYKLRLNELSDAAAAG
jgi:hypothetical protein